ncbi:hypothetical protein E2C01_015315 [Portunus trituberculatus]|uniref:Uncharacterized protein n=1 Tax=Portunus trituberculatus TaxID=210409 RepID=A0A5B7DMM5_PORTR|nr:hypothetical protein [Portunus trituberculatus]
MEMVLEQEELSQRPQIDISLHLPFVDRQTSNAVQTCFDRRRPLRYARGESWPVTVKGFKPNALSSPPIPPHARADVPQCETVPLSEETQPTLVDSIRTRALGDPSDPKARMVPLYHGGHLIFIVLTAPTKPHDAVSAKFTTEY